MIKVIHKINSISELKKIPKIYGVEVDIRGFGDKILLSHDPIDSKKDYDELEDYLKNFEHEFIIFNVKESGYEREIIRLAKKYNIENYFLLDVEFPFVYSSTRKNNFRKIAIRFSEAEPIEYVKAQMVEDYPLLDWVWVDTNTILPISSENAGILRKFKTCLVCPERWGRPEDIPKYKRKLQELNFHLDAVMTSKDFVNHW